MQLETTKYLTSAFLSPIPQDFLWILHHNCKKWWKIVKIKVETCVSYTPRSVDPGRLNCGLRELTCLVVDT